MVRKYELVQFLLTDLIFQCWFPTSPVPTKWVVWTESRQILWNTMTTPIVCFASLTLKTFSPLCAVNFPAPVQNLASWSTPPDRARRHPYSSFPISLVWSCSLGTSKPIGQRIMAFHSRRQADSYKELSYTPHIIPTKLWSESLGDMLIAW